MQKLLQSVKAYVPVSWRHTLLVRRRAPLLRSAGIVFIHIPKAAGSSVNQALYGRFMGHYSVQEFLGSASADLKQLPRFAITRNPWSRALSAYRFARAGKGGGDGVTAGMQHPERYYIPQFESFERFVIEWLDGRDIESLDGIFRPQLSYVTDKAGQLVVDHLGKVEDLRPTSEWLEKTIGKRVDFPHSNQTGEQVDFRSFYSDQTADIIARIYQNDIEAFGYKF